MLKISFIEKSSPEMEIFSVRFSSSVIEIIERDFLSAVSAFFIFLSGFWFSGQKRFSPKRSFSDSSERENETEAVSDFCTQEENEKEKHSARNKTKEILFGMEISKMNWNLHFV